MCLAHCGFGLRGQRRPREDETKITSAFGQRFEQLIPLGRNLHVFHERHQPRLVFSRDPLEHAAARDGDHHHRGSLGLPRLPRHIVAQRMLQQHVLQGPGLAAAAETEHPRAPPADRPRRHFEHVDTVGIDPTLRMYGPVPQAERRNRSLHRIENRQYQLR